MELLKIKRAFEKKIVEVLGVDFRIAFENVNFTTDSNPYAKVVLVPSNPENPTMGDSFYRERGSFVVILYYPKNQGTADILTKACQVRDSFTRGTTLQEDNMNVIVEGTPQISGCSIIEDKVACPVIIEYFANVLKV